MKSRINADFVVLLVLTVFVIIAYHTWFFNTGVLTSGDWGFHFQHEISQYFRVPIIWANNSFGSVDITSSFYPFNFLMAFQAILGIPYSFIERFLFMWPIALCSTIGVYFIIKNHIENTFIAVTCSVIYGFNTYFLILENSALTVLIAFALFPLLFLSYKAALEKQKLFYIILSGVIGFVISYYEFRGFYIITWILFIYFIFQFFSNYKLSRIYFLKQAIYGGLPIVIIGLLNSYWILGLNAISAISNNAVFSRDLFGNAYLNILRAESLFHPFWTGSKATIFVVQPMPAYFAIIPFLAFLGLLLNFRKWRVFYFGIIALLGITLTKQAGPPFPGLYIWLYTHFPGFNAFREASKFFFVIVFAYTMLIAYLLQWIFLRWHNGFRFRAAFCLCSVAVSALFLWNTKPLITGELGTLFAPRHVPNDYFIIENYIENQPTYFRTLWVPRDSRWSYYDQTHPKLSAVDLAGSEWKNFINTPTSIALTQEQQIVQPLQTAYAEKILDTSAIKYVIVPLRDTANDDDFFKFYGNDRQYFISVLDQLPYLHKINIGTKDVVVYENTSYLPYITSARNFIAFDSADNLNDKYAFTSQQLHQPFLFTVPEKTVNPVLQQVSSLYDKLTPTQVSPGKIVATNKNSNFALGSSIYTNQNKIDAYYALANNTLRIYTKHASYLTINGTPVDIQNLIDFLNFKETNVLTAQTNSKENYYITTASELHPMQPGSDSYLGSLSAGDKVTVYQSVGQNAIRNGSFEQGPWKAEVGDCNHYDDNAKIGMSLNKLLKSDGNVSLELDATTHIACTDTAFAVKPNAVYYFSFDYTGLGAKQAGYFLQFNDANKTVMTQQLPISGIDWQHFAKAVTVPNDATSAVLTIYGYATDNQTNTQTLYDNFVMQQLNQFKQVAMPYDTTAYSQQPLSQLQQKNTFEFNDIDYSFTNQIANGGFENGPWQQTVGDCNSFDNNPKISMNVTTATKTEGSQALEMHATRHIACTSTSFPVQEKGNYILSFDYQGSNAKQAGYYLQFNDQNKTVQSEQVPITGSGWQTFTKQIKTPVGATGATLVLYGYSSDGTTENITRYDNVQFIQIPDLADKYYVVTQPKEQLQTPQKTDFTIVNPTEKKVHITGAKTPFFLTMSESYHPQWQLEMDNGKVNGLLSSWVPWAKPNAVAATDHFQLDGFLNGWYVDTHVLCEQKHLCTPNKNGGYDLNLEIEFWPQRWFYVGLLISMETLAACFIYLGYVGGKAFIAKRRARHATN